MMATHLDDQYDDEPLELTNDQQVDDDDADDDQPPPDDDLTFTDDDPEPEETPTWAKHLRQEQARLTRENRELRQAAASRQTEESPIIVGDKPTLEGCDYDAERYERERDAWDDRRVQAADQQKKREEAQRKGQEEWAKVQRRYDDEKAGISVVGRDEAEATALASLSREQVAVIAKHADSPARFIIALGKNPAKLQQIASIEDPFALTKAMTKMEATLGKPKGSRPPEPERRVQGKPIAAGGADKKLTELEKKAEQTGDRSAIIAYKRSLKEKAK